MAISAGNVTFVRNSVTPHTILMSSTKDYITTVNHSHRLLHKARRRDCRIRIRPNPTSHHQQQTSYVTWSSHARENYECIPQKHSTIAGAKSHAEGWVILTPSSLSHT